MPARPRVVVVGSSNTDMVAAAPRLPKPGESVAAERFYTAAGGKGANQAVAAARAGARVTLVARVGDDDFGRRAIAGFRKEGIDCRWTVRDPEAPSGVALIVVDSEGENLIAVALGANMRLSAQQVEQAAPAIERAGALVLQLEVPLAAVRRAIQIAHAAGVPVILNPAPAPPRPLPKAILGKVDYLVLNETELEAIGGGCDAAAAVSLLEAGVGRVILTRGKRGATVFEPSSRPWKIPAFKVRSVDAVGAGDAFVGTLATFVAEGRPLRESLMLASAAAALSVTRRGAQPSLPTRAEILTLAGGRLNPR